MKLTTKEECEKAYTDLEISLAVLKRAIEGNEELINPVGIFNRALVTFARLIHEHFYNPPLKFEELKENMWVWDNYWEEYFEISEVYSNTKEIDVLIHQNKINRKRYATIKYTPNHFYRKEVQK